MITTYDKETTVKITINSESLYQKYVTEAYNRSYEIAQTLPDWVRDMPGMSGKKYRYFINSLFNSIDDPRYLEIGSHAGSTACAAIVNNFGKITCIDNWSEFYGPRDEFIKNINNTEKSSCVTLIEKDFRTVDYNSIGRFNIYLFDGPHDEQDQYEGIVLVQNALDDEYILIVDDWNGKSVKDGTLRAITDLNLNILFFMEIETDGSVMHEKSNWHNGYGIFVLTK